MPVPPTADAFDIWISSGSYSANQGDGFTVTDNDVLIANVWIDWSGLELDPAYDPVTIAVTLTLNAVDAPDQDPIIIAQEIMDLPFNQTTGSMTAFGFQGQQAYFPLDPWLGHISGDYLYDFDVTVVDPGVVAIDQDLTDNTSSGQFGAPGVIHYPDVPADAPATTAELLAARGGKTALLSELALAAYHLDIFSEHEWIGPGINIYKGHGETAYDDLPDGLVLLDAGDLPTLTLDYHPASDFLRNGIDNGIYTFENAAALVGRSQDALFIAFRGTNDGDADDSPDVDHWTDMRDHFDNFDPLFAALQDYLAQTPEITEIFVTGHSLGGAMAEALMRGEADFDTGLPMSSVTFASPGYPGSPVQAGEHFMSNLRVYGDLVPWANLGPYDTSGDVTEIRHNLLEQFALLGEGGPVDLHSMQLYRDFAQFFEDEGIFTTFLNGRDYDRIIAYGVVEDVAFEHYQIGVADDHIIGTGEAEIILGGGGFDHIHGGRGADYIKGGDGRDLIIGGQGHDYIHGGTLGDDLRGGLRGDTILGGSGFDTLSGGQGSDRLVGGMGWDDIRGGIDRDTLIGDGGNDTLRGQNGSDTLSGGADHDRLFGGDGADDLFGNGGNDTIIAGHGRDALYGGYGSDVFVFESLRDTNSHNRLTDADVIHDWDAGSGRDRIDLIAIDAQTGLTARGNQAFRWIGEDRFSGTKGELRYRIDADETLVLADRNGDGRADLQITIAGQIALTASDFSF